MKKAMILTMLLLICMSGTGCSKKMDYQLERGNSSIYSDADMDEAVAAIMKEFSTWKGCEMHSLEYVGDECNSEDNIAWMNQLDLGKNYTQCIAFTSSFHSPKNGGGSWQPDQEYTNWGWYLGREDGGRWKLLTWGY